MKPARFQNWSGRFWNQHAWYAKKNYMESTLHQAGRDIICEECSQVNWEGVKSRFQNAPGMAPWEKTDHYQIL